GAGDDIQALKGGLFEIADILVLNKSDMEGADIQMDILREAFQRGISKNPPVLLKTDSLRQKGILSLWKEICKKGEMK
ncbi:MAG: methylmalonyl Co-A mutase-associated GTPase MeaB, partial [Nitrospirae bacterium]|nr:methylmalonyl Co-A mutase-associated GTPase MeaB [Nitrospirota bacterium]